MLKVNEPKKRPKRCGSLLSAVTHFMIGFVGFQIGFALGGSSCRTSSARPPLANGRDRNLPDLVCPDPLPCPDCPSVEKDDEAEADTHEKVASVAADRLFPTTMGSLFVGAARVNRTKFAKAFEIGVPVQSSTDGNEEVLILYSDELSLPKRRGSPATSRVAHYDKIDEATKNCKAMRVVLIKPRLKTDCLAVMGQYDSFHVHLFRRVPREGFNNNHSTVTKQNQQLPLRYVHRTITDSGREAIGTSIPSNKLTTKYWVYLMDFLNKKDQTLERLKPLAQTAAGKGKVVVVMLVNWGQAGVFFNFVCAARSRGLDLSHILMFATDPASVELAESLGIHVFDVQDSFGEMPEEAAKKYGDSTFNRIMLAKVYCVQLTIQLGYDVIFQDVDVVWKRNPLEFFTSSRVRDYDMLFQDDGARGNRFGPYFGNSGFYYVKNNARTIYFFNQFVRMGDLILAYRSHQAAMVTIMSEHASWRGLRVKVFERDSPEGELFPCGHHFHRKYEFMKRYLNGTAQPYLFHMSWTESKDIKRIFFQQLGDWYVKPECEEKKVDELNAGTNDVDIATMCCSAEPLVECHYRDKPSKINCQDSDPMVKNKPSFW